MGRGARPSDTLRNIVGVGFCSSELICVRARPVRASDSLRSWKIIIYLRKGELYLYICVGVKEK